MLDEYFDKILLLKVRLGLVKGEIRLEIKSDKRFY